MVRKFYIMRHGETFATKRNAGYGALIFRASILEEGKPVIKKQAMFLKDIQTDANFCSTVKRCRQTAAIVTEISGKNFIIDCRLREYFLEPFGLFKRRVTKFLEMVDDAGFESVLIITHGAVIAALTHLLSRDAFSISEMTDYPKPGVLTIIERSQVAELVDFNGEK